MVAPVPPCATGSAPSMVEASCLWAGTSASVEERATMPTTRTIGPSMAMTQVRPLPAPTQSQVMGSGPMLPPRYETSAVPSAITCSIVAVSVKEALCGLS